VIADLFALEAGEPESADPFVPDTVVEGIGEIEGIVPRNAIRVPEEIASRLIRKLTVPVNVRNEAPAASMPCRKTT